MYDQAFEIAKQIESAFYPSEKYKLLSEAYLHAQISQGLCNFDDENDGEVKIEPLAEEV